MSNKGQSSYRYLDELDDIRRSKHPKAGRFSWKDYVMPELASRHKDFQCFRAMSEYGHYEKDFSTDLQNTNTTSQDKEKIEHLTHENNILKEQLKYLRQTLMKFMESQN